MKNGGVGNFGKEDIKYENLYFTICCQEWLCDFAATTSFLNNKTVIVVVIYRPPTSNFKQFSKVFIIVWTL